MLVGRPTQLIYISDIYLLIDDQHRNTNMNDKDHLVGQLTNHLSEFGWVVGISDIQQSYLVLIGTLSPITLPYLSESLQIKLPSLSKSSKRNTSKHLLAAAEIKRFQ